MNWLAFVSLLFRANMKSAKIQCKSVIKRSLSSLATLDGHCFHRKVASWCPPTFDKVSQPCACKHACMQTSRGFCLRASPTLWVKLSSVVGWPDADTDNTWWNMRARNMHAVKPSESEHAPCPNAWQTTLQSHSILKKLQPNQSIYPKTGPRK